MCADSELNREIKSNNGLMKCSQQINECLSVNLREEVSIRLKWN